MPSMVCDEVRCVAFNAVAGTDFHASPRAEAQDREKEQQNSVIVGLRHALEPDV